MRYAASKSPTEPQRVVITGAGIHSALGIGWQRNAALLREGKPAFRQVTVCECAQHRAELAAEIQLPSVLPPNQLDERVPDRLDRSTRMLLWAGHEALTQAGWKPGESLQVVLGTTSGGMISGESYFKQAIQTPGRLRGQASRVAHYQPQRQGITLLDAFGLQGSVTMVSNACVSGATAIGHAWELVRSGRAGKVLAGGFDALCQITYSGFDSLRVLSTTTCRPFDTQRDGLVLGEGAGLLCLESLESATDRGAGILGEIIGYGSCLSTAPLTCPHPEGEATLASMRQACSYQGVEPGDVGYVNAHGTGTPLNDAAEGHAINRWAGRNARQLWVSSTKACIGHTLGAAGAIEAIVCLMTLQEHWLPPQVTSVAVDPLCKFNVVRERTELAPQTVLSNSCSFGGTSVTLAFRRGSCSG